MPGQPQSVEHTPGRARAFASLALGLAPCLAVLGFLYEPLGVFGFGVTSPLAVVFGHLARHKLADRRDRRGFRIATAGLVLGYAGTVWLLFIIWLALTVFDEPLA